jgi:hypothetical protein
LVFDYAPLSSRSEKRGENQLLYCQSENLADFSVFLMGGVCSPVGFGGEDRRIRPEMYRKFEFSLGMLISKD